MSAVGRRGFMKSAIIAPFVLPVGKIGERIPPLDDLEGRPIKRAGKADAAAGLEREHMIELALPPRMKAGGPFKATVVMPHHPMNKDHYILSLRVYLNSALVTFTTLAPTWQLPELTYTFTFDKGDRIDVIADCTQHGLWGLAVPIIIEPSFVDITAGTSTDSATGSAGSMVTP